MKKIQISLLTMLLLGSTISCKDKFLDQQPVGAYNATALNNATGVAQLLVGAYSLLNGSLGMATTPGQMLFGSIRGGEANKGSGSGDQIQMVEIQKFQVIANNSSNQSFFQWFYDGIYRTNLVLKTVPTATGMTEAQKLQATAEARFLRGHYHFMLKRLYANVPYIDETAADAFVSNTDGSGNYIDIWPKIKDDFDFARKNLSEMQADLGRPNKWAAESYYAKALIYIGNSGTYTEALSVLNNIILNGKTNKGEKYALLANYHDNFNADKENNTEWVWGVQHSANDGTTLLLGPNVTNNSANGNLDALYIGTQNTAGPSTAFGFFNPTQWFVDHFRVDSKGLPYLDNYATNPNSVISDDGIEATSPFKIDTNPVDPRLDWSVGRRGIPFLDYGDFPGKSWIRDQASAGPYMSKKWFTLKKDIGKYTTNGYAINALNIPFIRYSDVLLFAAEMEARVGNIDKSREYVNQIRNRMIQNSVSADNWVKKADGITNAANYNIGIYPVGSTAFATQAAALKAVLTERLLELGLEGHRAYDLVRFGAVDGTTDIEEFNAYINFESKKHGYLSGGVYTKIPDILMPIPQTAIDNSQKDGKTTLKQNPGY